jgi:hypothetical protein
VSNHSSPCARSAPASPPTNPGIARLRTRATQHASPPPHQRAEGSGLAVSHHSSPPRTKCACQPSDQARDREAPYSRHPTSNRPLRTIAPQALDCCEPSQLSLRTECACQPSDQARDREAPYSRHPTSNRPLRTRAPQALDCCEPSQLSLRTKCACQPSDQARDREAPYSRHPTSNRPLHSSSRRLWTAVSNHSSPCARSAPASPLPQGRYVLPHVRPSIRGSPFPDPTSHFSLLTSSFQA